MERIEQDIERFLRTGEGPFDSLALELFGRQFERNKPYQAYCRSLKISPAEVRRWQDIPAVPVGAFKSAELSTFPVGQAAAVFESSGTTVRTPSRHYLRTLAHYELSLKSSFKKWMLPDPMSKMPFLILAPSPAEAPRSSLSWMMEVVKRTWGAPGSRYFVRNGRLDELWLATLLAKTEALGSPAALLGTTIAFLSLFDYCVRSGKRFNLPVGSRMMDTGGMKTQKREITRPEFVRQAGEFLGVPEGHCLNEYGMCEMSSQFYGTGPSSLLEGPPWVRTLVIDASTGLEVPDGQPGLLRHFDLANVDSVMAIQTEDLGMIPSPALTAPSPCRERAGEARGEGFVFLGRAPQADLKGCSVSAEAFLT